MGRKRSHSAPLALTFDGGLLLNRSSQIPPKLVVKLAQALAVRPDELFLGTRLLANPRRGALIRLDDAAAEAAARIHGLSAKSSTADRSRKAHKKV